MADDSMILMAKNYDIDHGAASESTVKAAVAGKRFLVHGIYLKAEGATDITFQSGTGTTAVSLSGPIVLANTDEISIWPDHGVAFKGDAVGDAFTFLLSGAVQVSGTALISEIDQ